MVLGIFCVFVCLYFVRYHVYSLCQSLSDGDFGVEILLLTFQPIVSIFFLTAQFVARRCSKHVSNFKLRRPFEGYITREEGLVVVL